MEPMKGARVHHVLVVANQTVGGDDLRSAVTDRLAGGEVDFHLVVPIHHERPTPSTATLAPPSPRVVAHQRLAFGIEWFEALGATVSGEVSEDETVDAITGIMARRAVDEVIVSTLHASLSHWLRLDLPSRLERHVDVPVVTVSADRA